MEQQIPNHLIHLFDAISHLVCDSKLEAFTTDLIAADKVCQTMGGALISRQVVATISLPYLKDN